MVGIANPHSTSGPSGPRSSLVIIGISHGEKFNHSLSLTILGGVIEVGWERRKNDKESGKIEIFKKKQNKKRKAKNKNKQKNQWKKNYKALKQTEETNEYHK